MYKRIIAVAAALGMIYGSILLPAADTGGEPVANVATTKQVVSKLNASYVSTEEKVYGPIRPVEVKSDDRSSESDMGAASGGEEAGTDGIGIGEVEVGTDIGPGSEGGNDDGVPGPDPDAGDYEPEPDTGDGEAGYDSEEAGEDSREDVMPEPEPKPEMEYLGDFTVTAYCGCEQCCGAWGNATASGAVPIAGHTAACNILPFGTSLLIDGIVYTVEDTGYTEFGDYWIDIYFDTHDEALAYGVQEHEVYMVY